MNKLAIGLARYRLPLSLAAVLLWVVTTLFPAFLRDATPLGKTVIEAGERFVEAVPGGIVLNTLVAELVLFGIALALGWNDLGFRRPRPWRSLWLLWVPGLYLGLFYGVDIAVGFPPLPVLGVLFVNTLLVGVSEELAFRGVLFRGLRSRLGMWPSILISSVLFGAVHVLNVLATGNLLAAAVQAVAATMTGVVFVALVIRTGSIIPAIVVHVLWDFGSLIAVTSAVAGANAAASAGGAQPEISPLLYLVPLAFNLPNFLYALFLLRRRGVAKVAAALPLAGQPAEIASASDQPGAGHAQAADA